MRNLNKNHFFPSPEVFGYISLRVVSRSDRQLNPSSRAISRDNDAGSSITSIDSIMSHPSPSE